MEKDHELSLEPFGIRGVAGSFALPLASPPLSRTLTFLGSPSRNHGTPSDQLPAVGRVNVDAVMPGEPPKAQILAQVRA
jgi:hypothetical protein